MVYIIQEPTFLLSHYENHISFSGKYGYHVFTQNEPNANRPSVKPRLPHLLPTFSFPESMDKIFHFHLLVHCSNLSKSFQVLVLITPFNMSTTFPILILTESDAT